MLKVALLLVVVVICIQDAFGFMACRDLDTLVQLHPTPPGPTAYNITVKLHGPIFLGNLYSNTSVFNEFIIQARTSKGEVVGIFDYPFTSRAKTMNCDEAGDTMTFNTNKTANSIVFAWAPPAGFSGWVTFHALVKNVDTFWIQKKIPIGNPPPEVVVVKNDSEEQDETKTGSDNVLTKYWDNANEKIKEISNLHKEPSFLKKLFPFAKMIFPGLPKTELPNFFNLK